MEIRAQVAAEIALLRPCSPSGGTPGDLSEVGARGGAPPGGGAVPPPEGAASPVARPEAGLSGHGKDKSNDGPSLLEGEQSKNRSDSTTTKPRKVGVPKYVLACKQKAWTKVVWPRDEVLAKKTGFCFVCKSWRCQADCAAPALWRDWLRICEGLKGKEDQAAYIVLTVETGTKDKYGHWAEMSEAWNWTLRPAMMKKSRWGKFQYAQTWEQTRKGFAHVNMGIVTPIIKTWCQVEGCKHVTYRECPNKSPWCRNCGGRGRKGKLCEGWQAQKKILQEQAVRAGFGEIVYLSPVQDAGKFSTYLNKRSGDGASTIASEITSSAVKSQLPVDAPHHFRRVRYSSLWPVPAELAKLCACGHGKHVHVSKKKGRPTACCFEGGECQCRAFVKAKSEYTGELRQKPLDVVQADIKAEEERLERVDQARRAPSNSCEISRLGEDAVLSDSSCIPVPVALVLGCVHDDQRSKGEDVGDAPLPSLWAERLADVLCEGAEARPLDGHLGARQQGREAVQVGSEGQVTGSRLYPHVARAPDSPSGPARTPARDDGRQLR